MKVSGGFQLGVKEQRELANNELAFLQMGHVSLLAQRHGKLFDLDPQI